MGERLNVNLGEQGCAARRTEKCIVQGCSFEVLLQTKCCHFMWECLYMYSSLCRAIYLFAVFSSTSKQREYKRASKRGEKVKE